MLTTLLLIVIIISCKMFSEGFTKLNMRLLNKHLFPFSKTTLNVRLTSRTCYDNGEDERRKKNMHHNYEYYFNSEGIPDSGVDFNNQIREQLEKDNENTTIIDNCEKLYTLIWFNCEDCIKLLADVKNDSNKILYIDGTHYFFDENDGTNEPLFYKDDQLIATTLFGIYEELFYNKIIKK